MAEDLVMPKLGLTMTEGMVAEWLVQDGDRVTSGQPVVVVETDKTNVEVEAESDGILHRLVEAGETVDVATSIARIDPE